MKRILWSLALVIGLTCLAAPAMANEPWHRPAPAAAVAHRRHERRRAHRRHVHHKHVRHVHVHGARR